MLSAEGLAQINKALKDPLKKKIIAKDETIIGGLILILSNNDKKIVIDVLDILLSLAAPVENRLYLHEFIGMVDQLRLLADHNNPLDHIRELSARLIARLQSEEPVPSQPTAQLKQRSSNVQHTTQPTNPRCAKTFNKPFLNMSRFKTITLQIEGLNDKNDMETCRERLLTVKGVISITFDLSRNRSIIRVKPEITASTLATAIQQSNMMIASQVVRTETGEERVIQLHPGVTVNNKENSDDTLPAYLPEEDSPVKADDRAVRRYGTKDEDNGAGWLGAAASFLAKSFYW